MIVEWTSVHMLILSLYMFILYTMPLSNHLRKPGRDDMWYQYQNMLVCLLCCGVGCYRSGGGGGTFCKSSPSFLA